MKKLLIFLIVLFAFGINAQDTLNIYKKGNILFMVDSTNNTQHTALARNVVVAKVYMDTTLFTFRNINFHGIIDVSYFKKEDDSAYTTSTWDSFIKNDLGL